jgi:quinolinate synthase
MAFSELRDGILDLKTRKNALILAHNYQRPEIQDIADYVGDSIELSRRAMTEEAAEMIIVAAVDFMAENAYLLNPDKTILLPTLGAQCPMARMLPGETVDIWRMRYPGVPIVLYVNTLAEAKAKCDVCCTSANAVEIVAALNSDTVIFGPDANLADYVRRQTGKHIIPIPENGFCPTHILFLVEDILLLREDHPDALVLAHPECSLEVQQIADFVGSTSQICNYAKTSDATTFVIATEEGILHRLRKENPGKDFILGYNRGFCPNMKLNTLKQVLASLRDERYVVKVPEPTASTARRALEKMFELTARRA